MPWVKLDDGFYDHEKFDELPDTAVALWVKSLAWANRNLTDGAIRQSTLRTLGYTAGTAAKLVSAGLWEKTDAGWQIHHFDQYQPSGAEVQAQREERRQQKVEAGRKGGITKAANRRLAESWQTPSTPLADAWQNASGLLAVCSSEPLAPTRPGPYPSVITSPPPLTLGVPSRTEVVEAALKELAARELAAAPPGSIKHPSAWTRSVAESNRHAFGSQLHKLAHEHPDWTGQQLADALAKPTQPSVVERPLCQQCHRHTTGLVECPPASPTCPTSFVVEVVS